MGVAIDGSGNVAGQVLIVDDEESLVDMLSTALRFAGYGVTGAATGLEALDRLQASAFDVVVLDVNLPDIDGFEVCRRIRGSGDRTPIIFLTARSHSRDLRSGFVGGGDDY